ncbi:MAG: HAD family phosphatase [Clostridia bacterium]|nr:HAD family phosphatase [Clostridia bacterium]
MIKAIFLDLDGTLLTTDKRINPSARAALARCRDRGVQVFFATARSPRLDQTLGWSAEDFALFSGGVYSNGACVDLGGERSFAFIDPAAVRACVEEVARFPGVHLSLHTPGDGYAFNFPPDPCMEKGWGLAQARILPICEETIRQTAKVLVFFDHLTDAVDPLPPELVGAIRARCETLARVYLTDAGRTVQLSSLDAGKLRTIERIRMLLGIEADEVAVFGDDINDLEMIAHYRHSVAMGNAVPEVRTAAGYITGSNDGDGVAHALLNLLPMA